MTYTLNQPHTCCPDFCVRGPDLHVNLSRITRQDARNLTARLNRTCPHCNAPVFLTEYTCGTAVKRGVYTSLTCENRAAQTDRNTASAPSNTPERCPTEQDGFRVVRGTDPLWVLAGQVHHLDGGISMTHVLRIDNISAIHAALYGPGKMDTTPYPDLYLPAHSIMAILATDPALWSVDPALWSGAFE